jgi:hypothetical protein
MSSGSCRNGQVERIAADIIKLIIIDHWRENGGRVPAFGGIMGYVSATAGYGSFDFGLPYSVTG